MKHPCMLWAGQSFENFCWLMLLVEERNSKYRWRNDKARDHASMAVLAAIDDERFEASDLTPFVQAQAMPEAYKRPDDPVVAYRSVYCGEKAGFSAWKKRDTRTGGRRLVSDSTNKLRSYGVAHRELMPIVIHDNARYANNRREQSHEAIRVRERDMRKFKSVKQAQRFVAATLLY